MKWIELSITTTAEACDAISEMLTAIGAGGVVIEDPNDIGALIQATDSPDCVHEEFINLSCSDADVIVKAYFPEAGNTAELIEAIRDKVKHVSNYLNTGKGAVGCSLIDDEDWANEWKKYYKPIRISERIVVRPSWEDYSGSGNEIVILMDPGMAFGTGAHETTRMCALLLEEYMAHGNKVMDIGCGTGILSIIAAKLGAEKVEAVDTDEVAVRVAKENCALNGVADRVNVVKGTIGDVTESKADIVVANIIADVIIGISEFVPRYLKDGGYFVASGIIKERKQSVTEAYARLGFEAEHIKEMGEWVAISFKCQGFL